MIAVIDPAVRTAEVQGFCKIARHSILKCDYHMPALCGLNSIHDLDLTTLKGIVLFGSGASVHENHAWQPGLIAFLKKAIDQGVPLLAICYGQQLLGHMFGTKVDFCFKNRGQHLGCRKIPFKEDSRLQLRAKEYPIVVSHGEELKEVPEGFEIWAASQKVKVDAIRHPTKPIWAVQSHPEATEDFIAHQSIELGELSLEVIVQESFQLVQAFLDYCAKESIEE